MSTKLRKPIPIIDLGGEYQRDRAQIDKAIHHVLERGVLVAGPEVEALESSIATAIGVRHAAGVASGSAALELALAACGIGAGDAVLTVSNTDIASSAAISRRGAEIVWIDIDERTFNADPRSLEERITPRARAILVTHMHGYPADMRRLMAIAADHDLLVIEDAALACGARYSGRVVGTFGAVGCMSFAPTKVLGGLGDAGAVVTKSRKIDRAVRILRTYGHREPAKPGLDGLDWTFIAEGFNARMGEIQAAILRVRLELVEERIARRRSIASAYSVAFADLPIELPIEEDGRRHVYRAYTILTRHRDELRRHLASLGVGTRAYYSPPLHLQPVYRDHARQQNLPVTERVSRRSLSLPIHPGLADDDVNAVVVSVRSFFQHD